MEQINKIFTNQQLIEQPLSEIVLNLILCMLLLSLVSWYYKKFSLRSSKYLFALSKYYRFSY